MRFGLTDSQYLLLEELIINPLKLKNALVYIFGSRARGEHQKFSDIDVLFIDDPKNTIDHRYISRLKESVEESNFPLKVDLVRDSELAKSFRESVDRDKVLV
ncbi:MAG: nucleotidyltransferase domain-containing protein [Bacteriovorax sp.]|jgi:predicted nucleotidyltransferase|nr:nucleotidyltransferase domain-containing protein [Bacteriovorax sp.]